MKQFTYSQINVYQYGNTWEAELITEKWKMLLTFGHSRKIDAYKEAKQQVDYLNSKH
jgi:hypothetical protein